jgi:rhodanese-related sulfurtransferase
MSVVHPLEIACQAVKQKFDAREPFLLLDCREPDEYAVAKIAGSTLIPMSQLAERVGKLADHKEREVVVHCHHGGRSLRVTHWLRGQGFAKVSNMTGGIDAWSKQVDPSVPRY